MRLLTRHISLGLRWIISIAIILIVSTSWALSQPMEEATNRAADAAIILATQPLGIEASEQIASLLNADALPRAYLAGPLAAEVMAELVNRGVAANRLLVLDEATLLLARAQSDGLRRLLIAAPRDQRLPLIRQAQTMGFAVTAIETGPSPTLTEHIAAVAYYWRTLLFSRAH